MRASEPNEAKQTSQTTHIVYPKEPFSFVEGRPPRCLAPHTPFPFSFEGFASASSPTTTTTALLARAVTPRPPILLPRFRCRRVCCSG